MFCFGVLLTKRAAIERGLNVKPGLFLMNQGIGLVSDVWMASL